MSGWNGKRVLVTGGSGFIGSHLTRRLVQLGARTAILTKYNSLIDNVRLADIWGDLRVIEADIRNRDSLNQISQFRPEVVYHLAAYNHVGDSFIHVNEALDCNTCGTANVIEAWRGYERFVYTSTSEVYGRQDDVPFHEGMSPNPVSPYSVGKYGGERYCRMRMEQGDERIVVLRPFNAYGPYQSPRAVIGEMILTCLKGETVRSTEGRQTRDFNFVGDLVDGFVRAGERRKALGQVINVGSGMEISILDLITEIHRLTGEKSGLEIGALEYRPTEIWRMFAANKRAGELLDWTPKTDFSDGLGETVEWYRAYLETFTSSAAPLRHLCGLASD